MANPEIRKIEVGTENLKSVTENAEPNVEEVVGKVKKIIDTEIERSVEKTPEYAGLDEVDSTGFRKIGEETNKEINKLKQKTEKELIELNNPEIDQETKEEYPEGHILNSNTLDKIAQLEAIDWNTLEFNEDRYNDYIKSQDEMDAYSVVGTQKIIKEAMNLGKKFQKTLGKTNSIYGEGGLNRYIVDYNDGIVKLLRGAGVTSGSKEYKAKLAQKANELGIKVEGE